MTKRSAREVLDSHLRLANEGRFEDDIARNFSADCVVLTADGVHRGHEGIRRLAERLSAELPGATFRYDAHHVAGEIGFLAWSASCGGVAVHDGADSFVFRDGQIVAQTIHYTLSVRGPTPPGTQVVSPEPKPR